MHAKKVYEDFQIYNLGEYHDLYVQNDTLLLADVFQNFKNMCFKRYELDPAKFLSATGLDIDMLLIVKKGIRRDIYHPIDMQKLMTNTWQIMIKTKNRQIFKIGMYITYMVS